ncbi:MAG: hypothetical protein ACD_23C01375G0001 [uncultured bacterium]|nr:MAG: hypothetical protein ACD_23C01375G0001 [uncultured bacterium]
MSGVPGRSLRCRRYRYPYPCKRRRRRTSGEVSLLRIAAIISLRFSLETMSVTAMTKKLALDLCSKPCNESHGTQLNGT